MPGAQGTLCLMVKATQKVPVRPGVRGALDWSSPPFGPYQSTRALVAPPGPNPAWMPTFSASAVPKEVTGSHASAAAMRRQRRQALTPGMIAEVGPTLWIEPLVAELGAGVPPAP